ncbi:Pyruvate/Phosphoenolpyruvate kinase-like domain-containing protein [Crepidotus variabilis]|uniref:Pyruvate/Phosphoenolpyruvate kinase-like domain-containing protein n=1 Tax=Crepidotus variabilis TaxID=179855 RepID=A0A9P6JKM7_9AGAR|nr:Pyruvate/Phosphoenolpyruvate kinase-like domain-containing protein [Crepidotus variabilis]
MATHALLNAFKSKTPAFGAWLTLPGAFHARTMAQASPHLSWIVIDCEHGLVPLIPGVAEAVSAIESAGNSTNAPPVSAIVRIPATGVTASSSWQIKHALDGGARGILVPLVSTADKAKEIISDARFPPVGRRGFGSPFTHGTWGVSAKEYLATSNESILVVVQIENREAVENVDSIAAVEGLDALFIGPYDLSISLGYPTPDPDPHPEVEKVIQKVLKATHNAGKKCAIFCSTGEQAAIRAKEGFDMINVTTDTGAMTEGISRHLAAALSTSQQ